MGHLHDSVILLLRPEFFSFFRKSVRHVPIHDQSFFNNFENDAIKLSVNKKIDWFVC